MTRFIPHIQFFYSHGARYVQIDTYGRSDREHPGKISQLIQLDEEAAKFIVDLLLSEFNLEK